MMSEELVTCITNKVLWKSRILCNTTFHFSFSRLPFISDAPEFGARPILREPVIHGIRRILRASSNVVYFVCAIYNQTECDGPVVSTFLHVQDNVVGIATRLRSGWSRVRKNRGYEQEVFLFPKMSTLALRSEDNGILSQGLSGQDAMLTTRLHLASRLSVSGAITTPPILPLYTYIA